MMPKHKRHSVVKKIRKTRKRVQALEAESNRVTMDHFRSGFTKADIRKTFGTVSFLYFLSHAPNENGEAYYQNGSLAKRLGIQIRKAYEGYAFIKVPVVPTEKYLQQTADVYAQHKIKREQAQRELDGKRRLTDRSIAIRVRNERRLITKQLGGRVISGPDGIKYLVPPLVQEEVESVVRFPFGKWEPVSEEVVRA